MMKLICALLALLVFSGCSSSMQDPAPNNPENQQEQNQMQQTDLPDSIREFAEHGLQFDVPENWSSSGFDMDFNEVKNGDSAYDTRTFYASIDGVRTPIAMVSRFARDAWDSLVKNDPSAEDVKLGTSKDGNFVYTYLIKDDIVPESDMGKKALDAIRKEAEALKDKIKITE